MCLSVDLNDCFLPGYFAVSVYLMRGEHDDRLNWPFRGDITVQVVNQINDQKHPEYTYAFNDKSLISSCSRVTFGERAESGREVLFPIRYFKDDCVKFRVTKVLVAL